MMMVNRLLLNFLQWDFVIILPENKKKKLIVTKRR